MAALFKERYRIQSARCPNWDYRSNGAYFITICTDRWDNFFGIIKNKTVILSEAGIIAEKSWIKLPAYFPFLQLDGFVIMPNHVHGIVIINAPKSYAPSNRPQNNPDKVIENQFIDPDKMRLRNFMSEISPKKGSVSTFIRSYKSAVTNEINRTNPGLNFKWQSRFHDHIIRNAESHQRIRQYIINNPAKWNDDVFYRLL